MKEVGINGNDEFKKMFSLIKQVEEIEEIRNKIGHGEKVLRNIDVGEVFYTVLTVIFSVVEYKDFESNNWETVII